MTFTEKQKEQIKLLVEQNDLLGAQKIILKEVESQVGESGEAFGKGPGADMRRFGDAVEGAQQALATGFLPVISRVSKQVQEVLGNPEVQRQIREFGKGAAGSIDDLINVAGKLPWAAIGDAFRLLGTGSKAALDFFTGLPPWVQTAVLTGWGLNKLTGGALGGIVGELGKGLIKGVLGMTAGVVHIKAGTVVGGGGGVPTAGGRVPTAVSSVGSTLLKLVPIIAGLEAGANLAGGTGPIEAFLTPDKDNRVVVKDEEQRAARLTAEIAEVDKQLAEVERSSVTNKQAVVAALNAEKAELVRARNAITAGAGMTRTALDKVNSNVALERAAANAYRAADANRIQSLRDSHAAANQHLAAIERKPTSFRATVNVTNNVGVEFSATAAAIQIRRVTQSTGNSQDFEQLN